MTKNTQLILPKAGTQAAHELAKGIEGIARMLPSGVDPKRFCYAAIIAANEVKEECSPASVFKAAYNVACLGLIPGAAMSLAYFVPFWNKNTKQHECQLIIGYQGFLDLSFGNNFLADCDCDLVLEGEKFERWTDESGKHFRHEPSDEPATRDNIVSSYCVWHTQGGGKGFWIVPRHKLDKIDTQKNVWKSRYDSMCLKTAVRQSAKLWKKTPRMAQAIYLDEQAERGESQISLTDIEETRQATFSLSQIDDVPDVDGPVNTEQPQEETSDA